MTTQELIDLIAQPQRVQQYSYEQLNALLLRYPYCQIFRQLLLLKQQRDQSLHYLRNLNLCAAYAPDRKRLYAFLHETEEQDDSSTEKA